MTTDAPGVLTPALASDPLTRQPVSQDLLDRAWQNTEREPDRDLLRDMLGLTQPTESPPRRDRPPGRCGHCNAELSINRLLSQTRVRYPGYCDKRCFDADQTS